MARSLTSSQRAWSFGIALVAFSLVGCPIRESSAPDAGRARDAPIVETGLTFPDALTASDALASRPDAPSAYCRGSCSPIARTGCADGDCVLTGDTASCGVAGILSEGSECIESVQCGAGLACFDNGSGSSTCELICCPGDDSCGPDATCGGSGLLVGGVPTSWGRCLPERRCTVLAATSACTEREACYVVDAIGTTECRVAGARLMGEVCEVPNDCASGFACVGASAKTCVALCSLDASTCPRATECVRQAYTPSGIGICAPDAPA